MNKLVKPSWPYLSHLTARDESNENFKRAWESVSDEPLSFDFQYDVLETDENGRQPRVKVVTSFDEKGKPKDLAEVDNKRFNNKSVSCLRRIADSNNMVCLHAWEFGLIKTKSYTKPVTVRRALPCSSL